MTAIKEMFEEYAELTGDSKSASLLVLSRVLREGFENFEHLDHSICLGIRKGLFGADAGDNDSLFNAIELLKEE